MEYRGRNIVDEITNEERIFKFELEGDNSYGEIDLDKEEFRDFVDKLVKLRDEIDSLQERSYHDTRVVLDVREGYTPEERNEYESYCGIEVWLKEYYYETKEERERRIEREKKAIDDEIALEQETASKRHDKYIEEAKELLEKEGYEVKKIHP